MSGPARSGPTTSAASSAALARVGLARGANLDQRHASTDSAWTGSRGSSLAGGASRARSVASTRPTPGQAEPSARPSITRTRGPTGAHMAGSVGPKRATVEQPTAAARCVGPESLPTAARERARSAAMSASGQSRARTFFADGSDVQQRLHRGVVGRTRQRDQGQTVLAEPTGQRREAGPHLRRSSGPGLEDDRLADGDPARGEPVPSRRPGLLAHAERHDREVRRHRSQRRQGLEEMAAHVAAGPGRRSSARDHRGPADPGQVRPERGIPRPDPAHDGVEGRQRA